MSELWLSYLDQDGYKQRVRVDAAEFSVGRHSDCDLSIADSRLSRTHARILKVDTGYEIEDAGSSNGTDVNNEPLFERKQLRNGDRLNFGGVEVVAEVVDSRPAQEGPAVSPAQTAVPAKVSDKELADRTIPVAVLLLVPVLAAVFVLGAAGIIYVVVSRGETDISQNGSDPGGTDDPGGADESPSPKQVDGPSNPENGSTPKQSPDPGNSSPSGDPGGEPSPTPADLSETAKVEVNGRDFLRKIAQNEPRAFMTTDQAKLVSARIKQFSGSSGLVGNINSARQNAAQLRSLATSKNMKPMFLAAAAIAKLGNNKGDALQTAQSMAETLDKLSIQLGNEFSDDCLLTIAAFDQGAAGDTMKMRNMLQDLATKMNQSSRDIRSIWFLKSQGKITPAEFDRALTFLAIGTIMQNPKEFGVNTEALNL